MEGILYKKPYHHDRLPFEVAMGEGHRSFRGKALHKDKDVQMESGWDEE